MKYASQIPRETIARLEAMAAEDPVRFCQPHPCPGVYSSREEEEFWCYKCWGHALEQPMPGSNLAEFFRQQDLQFPLPAGFREERRITVSHGSDCMAVDCICDAYTPHLFDSIADFYLTTDLPTANLESRRALRPQPAEGPARPDQDRLQSAHEHVRRDAGPVCERRDPLFLHGE